MSNIMPHVKAPCSAFDGYADAQVHSWNSQNAKETPLKTLHAESIKKCSTHGL